MALNETPHAGGFILSEANGARSRENVEIADGQDLQAGTVLGIVTATGLYTAYDNNLTNGAEEAAGVLLAATVADGADAPAVALVRDCEVNINELVFDDENDTSDIDAGLADLAALGIIAR